MAILTDKTLFIFTLCTDLLIYSVSNSAQLLSTCLRSFRGSFCFLLSRNCNTSFWVAETDRGSVTIFNRGKTGFASVMILSHHLRQSSAGSQTMYARWMTTLYQAGHSEYVRDPQPVPQRSMKRRGKGIPNCSWAVYFSADFDRLKKTNSPTG